MKCHWCMKKAKGKVKRHWRTSKKYNGFDHEVNFYGFCTDPFNFMFSSVTSIGRVDFILELIEIKVVNRIVIGKYIFSL